MKLVVLAVLGTGISLGAQPTPGQGVPAASVKPVRRSLKPVTVADIDEVLVDRWAKAWQKRLGLEEWDITCRVVRSTDLKPDTLGNLKWNSAARTATIKVLNPADYDLPQAEIPTDIEYTVVHELIHLQLAALPRDPNQRVVEERVVNRISEALFALEKGSAYRSRAEVTHAPKEKGEASRVATP